MRARLTIVRGDGSPKTLDLWPDQVVTIGRSSSNNIVLHDDRASRRHAQVLFERGQWFVRDNKTLNRTRVNSVCIEEDVLLCDGHEITIADAVLRFNLVTEGVETLTSGPAATADLSGLSDSSSDSCVTPLHADELAILHDFMTNAAATTESREVIQYALTTLLRHLNATVTGFMGLDQDNEPLPRVILPEMARVDIVLSRQLIQRVQADGRTIWLKAARPGEFDESESLMPFNDAICVPLKSEGAPFGALHVYRSSRSFLERDVRFCEMVAGYLGHTLARSRTMRSLAAENVRLRRGATASEAIVGESTAVQQLQQLISRAAQCPSTVLIHGETGAGKELVAHALHHQSPRHRGPFVVANCGAIASGLLESELFGHIEGAFTGATKYHRGLFEQADEGTLFLDEIGDMSPDCQVKVLRAIEGKGFRPVGGTSDVHVDVRVVAASHKDLAKEVRAGKFRQDLYYRLRVIYLTVPPLRDHSEDIPALVERFLDSFSADTGKRKHLTPAALKRLQSHNWPGNVRELRTVLESAVMLSDSMEIDADELWLSGTTLADQPQSYKLHDVEAWAIREVLKQCKGNISAAARTLDISRECLAQKIKKYQIPREGEE